jgi:hypothetical protein
MFTHPEMILQSLYLALGIFSVIGCVAMYQRRKEGGDG